MGCLYILFSAWLIWYFSPGPSAPAGQFFGRLANEYGWESVRNLSDGYLAMGFFLICWTIIVAIITGGVAVGESFKILFQVLGKVIMFCITLLKRGFKYLSEEIKEISEYGYLGFVSRRHR